jgi:uncharacterized delta-60 repeat protein
MKLIIAAAFACAAVTLLPKFILAQSGSLAQPGSLDKSFSDDGIVITNLEKGEWHNSVEWGSALVIQPDGKLVIAGSSGIDNPKFAMARYNSDGSLDSNGFGSGGSVQLQIGDRYSEVTAMALQKDGKIVVTGVRIYDSDSTDIGIIRYNTDGSLDSTFGSGGIVIYTGFAVQVARAIALQKDGKIVVGGWAGNPISYEYDYILLRYNNDGSLDSTFGKGGVLITDLGDREEYGYALVIQPDGKIVLAGYCHTGFALLRFNSDGSRDPGFGNSGAVITPISKDATVRALAIDGNGKIVAGGDAIFDTYGRFILARYNKNGSLDSNFATGGIITTIMGKNDRANAVAIQSDGKIVLAGTSWNTWTDYDVALARYDQDGIPDFEFGSDGKVKTDIGADFCNAIAIQPDGKIVIAGHSYKDGNTREDFLLIRYNSTVTAIEELSTVKKAVVLYPNPSSGSMILEISDPCLTKADLIIYDALGKQVHQQMIKTNRESLNLNLRAAIYLYKVSRGSQLIGEGKLVIQR